MTMTPRLRRLALTAHVACSVGWLGAIAVFLALAVIGLAGPQPQTARGVYLVMEPAAWSVLVPLAFASLLTGLVQSLGTSWGLARHYWVLAKLLINVVTTVVLLLYLPTFAAMAAVAADPGVDLAAVRNPSPVIHAGAAMVLLLLAAALSVYKPRGMTRYGWRRRQQERDGNFPATARTVTRVEIARADYPGTGSVNPSEGSA
jgi:hypothetical protein